MVPIITHVRTPIRVSLSPSVISRFPACNKEIKATETPHVNFSMIEALNTAKNSSKFNYALVKHIMMRKSTIKL